jgi:hypothetical protein
MGAVSRQMARALLALALTTVAVVAVWATTSRLCTERDLPQERRERCAALRAGLSGATLLLGATIALGLALTESGKLGEALRRHPALRPVAERYLNAKPQMAE